MTATALAIRTIVVPTDFSDGSQAASSYAATVAEALGARIVMVHVVETMHYGVTESMQWVDLYANLSRVAQPVLEQQVSLLKDRGIDATFVLAQGVSYAEIVETARRVQADLIVMGTHGRRGVSRLFVGSVTERVVHLSPCPVLTVPAGGAPSSG